MKGILLFGSYGCVFYVFEVNVFLRDGICDIELCVGYVLIMWYRFWCIGWYDFDGFFRYEIYYVCGKEELFLYYGIDVVIIILFLLGDGENYIMNIIVCVFDRLGVVLFVRF